jgi:hypothetical protein
MYVRVKISNILKICTVLSAFFGVGLSMYFAVLDGYSHWSKRLLYFTAQSNLWVGFTFLALLYFQTCPNLKQSTLRTAYLLKYLFTVSISVTGIFYCGFLGPFADPSYRPWSFSSILTHVCTPTFAIADFFADDYKIELGKREIFLSALPPLFYVLLSALLFFMNTDFGRGVNYPYFFMNYRSPVGLFGFSKTLPFFMGAFYWLFLLCALVLGIATLYAKWNQKRKTA